MLNSRTCISALPPGETGINGVAGKRSEVLIPELNHQGEDVPLMIVSFEFTANLRRKN